MGYSKKKKYRDLKLKVELRQTQTAKIIFNFIEKETNGWM